MTHDPTRDEPSLAEQTAEERDDQIVAVAFRWSLTAFVLLAMTVGAAYYLLTREAEPEDIPEVRLAPVEIRSAPQVELPQIPFTDITESAGIQFLHENGAAGEKLLPETMGAGCAFFDFDGDGDQDLLFVNGQAWPWDQDQSSEPGRALFLYQNDGTGRFSDVTQAAGLDKQSYYGQGIALGDYDNDGRVDLFVSALGSNHLYHNEGNGKFREVTDQAGVAGEDQQWSTSCGWFDYDRDGDLDLFVCNYVVWSREIDVVQNFQLTGIGRVYGRPQNFEGTFPYLYRNEGNGRFSDVTADAGLQVRNPATGVPMAKGLGVSFADFDHDGWIDILMANDTVQNFLFHNQQDGTFKEVGGQVGVAFDMDGQARGAMGVDIAHFRNDDSLGIAIGNFANEMTALYVTEGEQMLFMDEAISSGLGPSTRLLLTFGVLYLDCDLDGRLDLFAANGHLEDEINRVQASQHYEQPPQLFWNAGSQQATEFLLLDESRCGKDFYRPLVGRAASYADIDADGDLDLVITAVASRPRLLRNDQSSGHNWLRVTLQGTSCNRDAIGSWIELRLDDQVFRRQVMPTRSYLSQVELPVTFGLGTASAIESLQVEWPDGTIQTVSSPELNQMIVIKQKSTPPDKSGVSSLVR